MTRLTPKNSIIGKPAILTFCPKLKLNIQASQAMPVNTGPHYSKALPSNIDYESISPYFVLMPYDVIQNTLRQTAQLAKSTIHHPMRRHLKSKFQRLRHKRLKGVIDTDKCFRNERSIEGYYCAQLFFGMTYKSLCVTEIKTGSEFLDVYLDFIRQNSIPSALLRDNAKSEMSQRV
jgi:hypothetical protein